MSGRSNYCFMIARYAWRALTVAAWPSTNSMFMLGSPGFVPWPVLLWRLKSSDHVAGESLYFGIGVAVSGWYGHGGTGAARFACTLSAINAFSEPFFHADWR